MTTTLDGGTEMVAPTEQDAHRIPGCDGRWHFDGVCETTLADLATPGASLVVTVSAEVDQTMQLVVWEGDDGRDLIRTSSPAEARAFADQLRALAAAVDKGAAYLA